MNLIKAILEWPVIVQGALGSALFWLILLIGQRLVNQITERATKMSSQWREHVTSQEYLARRYFFDVRRGPFALTLCIYQSLHYAIRGLLWLILGLIAGAIDPIFSAVGGIGALYFLLRAAHWVASTEDDLTELQTWERIAELEKTILGNPRSDTTRKLAQLRAKDEQNGGDNQREGGQKNQQSPPA